MSSKEKSGSPAADETEKPKSGSGAPVSKSSPVKKTARPGKARASLPAGGSTKKNGSGGSEGKSLKTGDIVLARLKGFPPWPARIADPDSIPTKVLQQRPGKNPSIYCCHFFPVGDYAWLNTRDINPLSSSAIQEYLAQDHRKPTAGSKGLYEAYQTASDPTEWDEAQSQFRADREAEDNEDVDELDEDDEDGEEAVGKKRKAPASKGGKKKAAKVEKAPKSDAPASKKAVSKAKPKSAQPKSSKQPDSKAAVPENQAPADDDPLSNDPDCVKVKDWRHKLQRAFLGKGPLPSADEMTTYDEMFKSIEEYDGMTVDALQYSKIGKVMKKLAVMDNIPRNDEFKLTERAQTLMNNWSTIVDSRSGQENGANGDHGDKKEGEATAAAASTDKPEANGETSA